jgi:hypothetical protein
LFNVIVLRKTAGLPDAVVPAPYVRRMRRSAGTVEEAGVD